MARINKKHEGAEADAAAGNAQGGDVKIDIEVEGDENANADAKVAEKKADGTCAAAAPDPDDERARVEAAIKAGEQAANQDFKSQAEDLRAERDDLAKQLADVAGEIDAAKAEASESADRLARLQADWENYRRRTERERAAECERACEGLVKNLLPVIDDLERAVAHASGAAEGDEVAKQLVDGVSAVHTKMVDVLVKQGVEVIDPAGEAFDPLSHQAVGRVENPKVFDETVADVYQKGYRMGGKVVRPAMVTVAYGGEKRPAPDEDAKSADAAASKE